MSISFTPVLKKKYKSHKYGIINIRITQNRKSKYIPIGISLSERFWNKNGKTIENKVRSHRDFNNDERNSVLSEIKRNLTDIENSFNTSQNIDTTYYNQKSSFLFQIQNHIKFLEQRNKIGTSKRYRTTLLHINKYLRKENKSDLSFKDLTSQFIESFETYLIGEKILMNTTKNYINCIKRLYTKCIGSGLFTTSLNPFIHFKNIRQSVKKEYLLKKHVEIIMMSNFEKDNPLYHTKNYFLFQIFGQGLRISDLLTLRFENIIEGDEIVFIQFKTKKENKIYLTPTIMRILMDYIHSEYIVNLINLKYKFTFKGEVYHQTFDEVQFMYSEITHKRLQRVDEISSNDVEVLSKILQKVLDDIFTKFKFIIHNYSKEHKSEFIFPSLNPNLFVDTKFNKDTLLTKTQYNHLQSRTTVYNKSLKKLQKEVNEQFKKNKKYTTSVSIDIPLTSHLPRHTYTNLMLELGGDVYEISKSIGHMGIKTTDNYISEIKGKVQGRNLELGKTFTNLI